MFLLFLHSVREQMSDTLSLESNRELIVEEEPAFTSVTVKEERIDEYIETCDNGNSNEEEAETKQNIILYQNVKQEYNMEDFEEIQQDPLAVTRRDIENVNKENFTLMKNKKEVLTKEILEEQEHECIKSNTDMEQTVECSDNSHSFVTSVCDYSLQHTVSDDSMQHTSGISSKSKKTLLSEERTISMFDNTQDKKEEKCNSKVNMKCNSRQNFPETQNTCNENECPHCFKQFSHKGNLNVHINTVHKKVKKYQCNVCDKMFSLAVNLKIHMNAMHKGIKYECKECHKMLTSIVSLRKHVNNVHRGIKNFKCNFCNKMFSWYSSVKAHTKAMHESKNDLQMFSEMVQLESKVNSAHRTIKYYRCRQCSKIFSHLSHLNRHVTSLHKGIKYECYECHKTFCDKQYLRRHMHEVHKGNKYKCNICQKRISRFANVKKHIDEVHKGIKHECDICHKMLSTFASLKRHINVVH